MDKEAGGEPGASGGRRAIVCYVDDRPAIIQQGLALWASWRQVAPADTDLVVFGPEDVVRHLPEGIVAVPQRPAADDPVWAGYRVVNAVACVNGAGAEVLDRYTHLLRTDADTFITPAWNAFRPQTFAFGNGGYLNDDDTRGRIRQLAADFGLTHRGIENVHATWYGPTDVVRSAAAITEMLTRHLLTEAFADDPGAWPGWYRGVAMRYAGEIAVNHCAPDAARSAHLDGSSTSAEPAASVAHVHSWHTDERFSKHRFMAGDLQSTPGVSPPTATVRDYCVAMSLRSLDALDALAARRGVPPDPADPGETGGEADE